MKIPNSVQFEWRKICLRSLVDEQSNCPENVIRWSWRISNKEPNTTNEMKIGCVCVCCGITDMRNVKLFSLRDESCLNSSWWSVWSVFDRCHVGAYSNFFSSFVHVKQRKVIGKEKLENRAGIIWRTNISEQIKIVFSSPLWPYQRASWELLSFNFHYSSKKLEIASL